MQFPRSFALTAFQHGDDDDDDDNGLDGQLVASSHNIVKTAYPDVIVPEGLSSPNGDDFPMPTCASL